METIIESISQVFTSYGMITGLIIFGTIISVNLVKAPIKRAAEKYAQKNGLDKAVITQYLVFLPIIFSFIFTLLSSLINVKFQFASIDWSILLSQVTVNSTASIAVYESIKKAMDAYVSKKAKKQEKLETTNLIIK